METIMADLMFELPSNKKEGVKTSFTVTKEYAEQKLGKDKMVRLKNAV
jgi:hypothetical protein